MARLLGEGGLDEETRTAMLEAVLPLSRALAIENRLPEPGQLDDALDYCKDYLEAPGINAFEIASFLRQLKEIWQVDEKHPMRVLTG